jgi:hypothetical protein
LWNESWVKSPLIPLGFFGSKSNVACLGIRDQFSLSCPSRSVSKLAALVVFSLG